VLNSLVNSHYAAIHDIEMYLGYSLPVRPQLEMEELKKCLEVLYEQGISNGSDSDDNLSEIIDYEKQEKVIDFDQDKAREDMYARLTKLSVGQTTRVDKQTLGARHNLTKKLSFPFYEVEVLKRLDLLCPRTMLVENAGDEGVNIYVLLKSKFTGGKRMAKVKGSFKTKSNALQINIPIKGGVSIIRKAMLGRNKYRDEKPDEVKRAVHNMQSEAKLQSFLSKQHSSIAPVRLLQLDDTCLTDDIYIVMDEMQPLARYLNPKRYIGKTHLEFYSLEIASVLSFLHKLGLVYRDLKPDNMLALCKKGIHFRLTDFGFVTNRGSALKFAGTMEYLPTYVYNFEFRSLPFKPYYTASELGTIRANVTAGHYSHDIWSLGVCLFEFRRGHLLGESWNDFLVVRSMRLSRNTVDQAIYQIVFPLRCHNYLLASNEILEADMQRPLAQRRYLSMEKICRILDPKYNLQPQPNEEVKTELSEFMSFSGKNFKVPNAESIEKIKYSRIKTGLEKDKRYKSMFKTPRF